MTLFLCLVKEAAMFIGLSFYKQGIIFSKIKLLIISLMLRFTHSNAINKTK